MQQKRTSAQRDGVDETLRPIVISLATQPLPGLKDTLWYLLRRTRLALRADTATVLLFEENSLRWSPIAADGLSEMSGANASPTGRSQQEMSGANASPTGRSQQELEQTSPVPLGITIARQIAKSRSGLIFHNVVEMAVISRSAREPVRSVAGVPLRVGDRLRGVLYVGSLAPLNFEEKDLLILRFVGERAAAAIERERVLQAKARALTLPRTGTTT